MIEFSLFYILTTFQFFGKDTVFATTNIIDSNKAINQKLAVNYVKNNKSSVKVVTKYKYGRPDLNKKVKKFLDIKPTKFS